MTTVPKQDLEALSRILDRLPEWMGSSMSVQPLSGGNAHKNYLIESGGKRCVVKIWNSYWETVGVCPAAEVVLENTRIAAEMGVGAQILVTTLEPLGLVLAFLEGNHPELRSAHDAIDRLVPALKKLHGSPRKFLNDIDPFDLARRRFDAASRQGTPLPAGIETVRLLMDRVEKVLNLDPSQFVPCHLDVWDANVLETPSSEAYRIIDWDLSGNCDPGYELGFIAAYNGFDPVRADALFLAYYGAESPTKLARARLFMAVAHWSNSALWITALGNADPNDGSDFAGELRASWEGLLREVTSREFHRVLDLAAKPQALV